MSRGLAVVSPECHFPVASNENFKKLSSVMNIIRCHRSFLILIPWKCQIATNFMIVHPVVQDE